MVTKNGYKLAIHRIPNGRNCPNEPGKIPVLLVHGLFCSSDNFLITGPEKGLAFVLADNCYDVWMPNARGNKYSKSHVTLSCSDPKFWDFSWHELGVDDIPCVIDYVLKHTGQCKLFYIAHSQSATVFFTFNIFNQNYADKICAMFAFSPVAFLCNTMSPLFLALGKIPIYETVSIKFQVILHNRYCKMAY